jgi:Holliday junction resolvasome RuvABC endonuclease subunit
MKILGIDPGNEESAYALVNDRYEILSADKVGNSELLEVIDMMDYDTISLESIQSYGMPVGRTTFETCFMIGRIIQMAVDRNKPCLLYPRPKIAQGIIGQGGKYNDTTMRQALLIRFGGDKKGEPLNILKGGGSDKRSAFATAAYHLDGAKLGGW